MKFVNLTPHDINDAESGKEFQPSGEIVRISEENVLAKTVDGVNLYSTKYGELAGLPEPAAGVIYIVSGQVLSYLRERTDRVDVISPGPLVRDTNGKPIGCKGFRTIVR